ncbi:MAG: TRAP transporter fused permease subunit [Proteobacteria bacterium]|jgi:TRAP transporter 4TM/12TM fusion protein|nr:TRAP transporter fused permease subunit [Pseudomonadota bacterium]
MTARLHDREGELPEAQASRWRGLLMPVPLVALAWTLFQVAIWWFNDIDLNVQYSGHVSFAVAVALLATGEKRDGAAGRWMNRLLAVVALLPTVYLAANAHRITFRVSGLDPVLLGDYVCAIALVVLLFEASRRVLGWGMCVIAGLFIGYQLLGIFLPPPFGHNQAGLGLLVDQQFLTLEGVFGIPTGVSVRVVFYFILFAAVFEAYGGGRMIIELALALTGRSTGGPAKAAIVGSAMMGTVSGSAVANVMAVGIFTIPLMKRAGYPPRFAAAVEAVGSTGGQLMPPVMGAGAFVMADFLRIPYSAVIVAAVLPALFYYLALFLAVDFKARLAALGTLSRAEIPAVRRILAERGHLLLPLVWLTVLIVSGYGIADACLQAIAGTIVIGSLRKTTRQGWFSLVQSLSLGAQRSVSVALPCALAGIIVGVIAFTGLGTKFTGFVVDVSAGSTVAIVVLAMIATLILGCGMPTTSAYIMGAVLLAPALITAGVAPLVAHMFVFYFAILSMITPPVALAAYAAAAIADTPPNATGWEAALLGIPVLIIPLVFFGRPSLLLIGGADQILVSAALTFAAIVALSGMTIGWLFRPLAVRERLLLGILGIGTVIPLHGMTYFSAAALAIVVAWLVLQRNRVGKAAV